MYRHLKNKFDRITPLEKLKVVQLDWVGRACCTLDESGKAVCTSVAQLLIGYPILSYYLQTILYPIFTLPILLIV